MGGGLASCLRFGRTIAAGHPHLNLSSADLEKMLISEQLGRDETDQVPRASHVARSGAGFQLEAPSPARVDLGQPKVEVPRMLGGIDILRGNCE
jgi:hypothetical protein